MAKPKAATGILLEFGRDADAHDEAPWDDADAYEEEEPVPEGPANRPARNPQALLDIADKTLAELRQALSEMD